MSGRGKERSRSREIRCPRCDQRISTRDTQHLRGHGVRLAGWRCKFCTYQRPSDRSHDVVKHVAHQHSGRPEDLVPVFERERDDSHERPSSSSCARSSRAEKREAAAPLRRSPRKRSRTSSTSASTSPRQARGSEMASRPLQRVPARTPPRAQHHSTEPVPAPAPSPPADSLPRPHASASAQSAALVPVASSSSAPAEDGYITIHIGPEDEELVKEESDSRSPRKMAKELVRRVRLLSPLPESSDADDQPPSTSGAVAAAPVYTPDGVAAYIQQLSLSEWEELRATRTPPTEVRSRSTQVSIRTSTRATQTQRPATSIVRTGEGGLHAELPDGSSLTLRGPLREHPHEEP